MPIAMLPGKPHERLHRALSNEGRDEIVAIGLKDACNDDGATSFLRGRGYRNGDGADGGGDGGAGEPDSSGSHRGKRRECEAWPTLVIEASNSSTLADLRKDMQWWFSTSDHQVKMVLLAKLDRAGCKIILKWVETTPPPREGPATRAAQKANAQEITIDWIHGTAPETPASHTVTSGDLQPEFDLLFLRPPGPAEGDFLIAAHVDQQSKASQVKTARNLE